MKIKIQVTKQVHLNKSIQVFRGIAIIAVVVIHTIPGGEWQVFCRPFVNYAVAIFIFLSGYLTHEENQWAPLLKKRILRVLIPYCLWSIIYCLPLIIEGRVLSFFLRLITAQTCFPFYYIFVYVQFVILTPLLFKLLKSKYREIGWFVTPIYIIFSVYIPRLTHPFNPLVSVINIDICLGWFCFYYLGLILGNNNSLKGYYLSIYRFIQNKSLILYLSCYFVSILFQMVEIDFWFNYGVNNCGSQGNLSSIFSNLIFSIIVYKVIINKRHILGTRILSIIGNYSFGIYMSHVLVIKILNQSAIYHQIPYIINSLLIVCISLIFCYILSQILGVKYSHYLGLE